MPLKSFKVPFFFLLTGIGWALFSDPFISLITGHLSQEIQNFYHSANDLLFVGIVTIILYIQLKMDNNKVTRSEKQYRSLFTANPNPMWIVDSETMRYVEVNDAAISTYGYKRSEFLKMTVYDIRSEEECSRIKEAIKLPFTGQQPGYWKHRKKSGEEFMTSVSTNPILFNTCKCVLVMAVDVTKSIENEKKLQESYLKEKELNEALEEHIQLIEKTSRESRQMAEVINKIRNLVLIVDEDGIISWVNTAFSEFTGHTFSEVIGKQAGELLFGPNTNPKTIQALVQSLVDKKFFSAEIINYKKNREEYWVQLNISPIFDKEGNLEFFISVENVITERKEKEQQLNNQYLAFKQIAWSNSHEVRRPLASILSLTELLKEAKTEKEIKEYLDLLDICSVELDTIVRANAIKINQLELTVNPT